MDELFKQIFIGIIVAIIVGWLGFGGKKKVIVQGTGKIRKTGKWIMLISGIFIFIGLIWVSNDPTYKGWHPGYSLSIISFMFFLLGKLIAWWQKVF